MGNNKRKKELAILAITILGVVGIMLFVVPAQDVNKRQRANEASTLVQLRRLTSIEKGYSQQHAREGYVCDLGKLRALAHPESDYDSDFFSTGRRTGYSVAISGCETASNSPVEHYRIVAVPLQPGKSGWRTFCTDESGILRYVLNASAESCVALGNVID